MFKIKKYFIVCIILFIIIILFIYFLKSRNTIYIDHFDYYQNEIDKENSNEQNESDNKEDSNEQNESDNKDNSKKIPKNIYQFWHSEELPEKMKYYNNNLKNSNPEFTFFIYNINDARLYIKDNFDENILKAYDMLKPTAYKSDLWRYCILYKNGGIYLDIKYSTVNNFKLINLIDDEIYCLNKKNNDEIYNGIMICKKDNPLLLDCINKIVENVNNNFYGKNVLEPTGSLLYTQLFKNKNIEKKNTSLNYVINNDYKKILYNDNESLISYPDYDYEKSINGYLAKYIDLYNNKDIYYKIDIPLNIYQTWFTKKLPKKMKKCTEILKKNNPEFNYYLYDDNDCHTFIKKNFNKDILDTFDKLIPGAYKAELGRYCILYINGGVYIDIKFKPINNFKFMNLLDKEYLCKDIKQSGSGIYNAIMICKKNNTLLLNAINIIVDNVKNNYYGNSMLEPTGPLLFKKILKNNYIENLELSLNIVKSQLYILYNNKPILEIYDEYRDEQRNNSNKPQYATLWLNRNIYKI